MRKMVVGFLRGAVYGAGVVVGVTAAGTVVLIGSIKFAEMVADRIKVVD